MTYRLVSPSKKFQTEYIQLVRESSISSADVDSIDRNFDAHLAKLEEHKNPTEPERVPQEMLWLIDDDRFIGYVKIRSKLNEKLRELGGHIGYEILSTERRKGYGTKVLALALKVAKGWGLNEVMLSCDVSNVGSRRIIENNGGILEGEFQTPLWPVPILKYWIKL